MVILEGNGSEDGFQSRVTVLRHDEVLIVMVKLLLKAGLLVDIVGTDQ